MTIKEVKKDLFTMSDDYALAHCISADFKLGAGIARKFDESFDARQKLFNVFHGSWIPRWDKTKERYRGGCILINHKDRIIFNLVTKRNYWDKPTLSTIKNALDWLSDFCYCYKIKKLAMPRIGCGLDKQNWENIKPLIEESFKDSDIEIVICVK